MTPDSAPLGPGSLLKNGEIKLLSRLGTGGFGAVYLAQTGDGLKAVKIVDTALWSVDEYEVFNAMLMAEASFLSTVEHPILPKFSELVAEDKRYYLVMEWVKGLDLEQQIEKSGPLPLVEIHALLRDLLDGLEHFHSEVEGGMVFGDLKPANVMRVSADRFRLVDLGLASRAGLRLGGRFAIFSPNFSAPERIVGALSHPSQDIYSLGATAYYALTGVEPAPRCSARELQETVRRRLEREKSRYDSASLRGWEKLLTLLLACLDPDPAGRPRDVNVLRQTWLRLDAISAREAEKTAPDMEEMVRLLYRSKDSE